MTQLTVTGPFVNKTLFEQAGIAMPGAKATWEDWAKATKDVAAKVQAPFPVAMDRSGHRFFGLAISEGAKVRRQGRAGRDRRRLQARRAARL
jgi:alpha-1,4-digalacturonate transport system substrate-binding protein